MSVLMHLCRECGHREVSHDGGDRGYSQCCCCRGAGEIDPIPRLVPTFTLDGKAEPLYRPGSEWNPGSVHRLTLCGCTACRTAYEEASGASA